MICKMCNSENSESSKFCAACGAKLEAPAPATEAVPMFCSVCGSALEAGVKFCAGCGTAVGGAPAAVAEPVPVMAAAPTSVASAPVAAPAPANEAPVASAIPTPVNEAPVTSAVPMPVNDAQTPSAVPAPVNEASSTGFGNAVAVQTVAPTEFGAGTAEVQPAFNTASSNAPSELPAFEVSGASAVVAKPVKKGGKKALKIVLISLGALLIVAGVVYALFFREFFHPLFMGNQGYAAKIERDRTKVVMESEAVDSATKKSDVFTDTLIKNMLVSTNISDTSAEINATFSNIKDLVSTYYAAFMEAYGVNAVDVTLDADIELSDAALSAMEIDDEETLDIIDYINDSEFKMTYATSEDAIGMFVEAVDGDGFTINAKGIVFADGDVALMLPFGTDKCIKMKVYEEVGTVTESEELDVDIDPAEMERISQGIIDIYLKHYEKSDTTIENSDLFIGGTSDNPTIKASGRLITVNMSGAAIGEMLAEMITYIAEDQYLTGKIIEMAEEAGTEVSAVDYKNELISAADEVKHSVPFGITIKTLVNYNGEVLGGAYNVTVPEQGSFGVKYIMNGNDCGFAITAMGMEICNITVDAKNDTDGTIRLESSVLTMGMSAAGMTGPNGINIDYAGVKNEKFFNTEVPVGTYDIYLAGTSASGPENSAFRIRIEDKVEGDTIRNTFKAEMAEYGSIALNMTTKAYNNTDLLTIPSDTLNFSNPNEMTEEQTMAAGQYILDMVNEITATCESSSSPLAQALAPELGKLAVTLDDALTPKADYSDIQELNGDVYDLMFQIMDKYEEGAEYISDSLAEEMGDLYSELEAMYDDLENTDSMTLSDFELYQSRYEGYRMTWNGLERKADKEIENGQNNASQPGATDVALVGTWRFYECDMYGFTYTAEELEIDYSLELNADGSMKMTYLDESTTGTWSVEGNKLIVTEITDYAEYVNEFTIEGDIIILQDLSVLMKFKK